MTVFPLMVVDVVPNVVPAVLGDAVGVTLLPVVLPEGAAEPPQAVRASRKTRATRAEKNEKRFITNLLVLEQRSGSQGKEARERASSREIIVQNSSAASCH
jgi:hypothetical protein